MMDAEPLLLAGVFLLVAVAAAVVIFSSVRIYREHERGVRFRLGRLNKVLGPGIAFAIPLIDSTTTVDMKSRLLEIPGMKALTAENAAVFLDVIARYRISSPELAVSKAADATASLRVAVETSVRSLIGELDFADVVKKREFINAKLRETVSERAGDWGVRVEGVEITDVTPSERALELINKRVRAKRKK